MSDPEAQVSMLPRHLAGGRFELRRVLGEGGLGVVYAAFDQERDQQVALKTLPEMDAHAIGLIKHEFRALVDVAHPNLVRLHELISDGDSWFFTMELVDGQSFLDHVRGPVGGSLFPAPPLPPTRPQVGAFVRAPTEPAPVVHVDPADPTLAGSPAHHHPSRRVPASTHGPKIEPLRDAMRQLARAVAAIHAAGKLHCDLKPSNVMVRGDGRLQVLDFGLVTELWRTSLVPDESGDDHVCGTPIYMSPEQAVGDSLTEASDWYAVGVMLYEALTGRVPFEGTASDVLHAKVLRDPSPPESLIEGLPADLCALCGDLLRRRPWERPPQAEILARLGDGGSSEQASTQPPVLNPGFAPALQVIGREREQQVLMTAFLEARGRRPVSVYVHGVSGIGKSTLLRHFLRRVQHGHDAVVLAGRCYEREQLAFKAFDSVIDALTGYLGKLDEQAVAELLPRDVYSLSRLFPVLRRVPAIARAPQPTFEVVDPHQVRRRAFAAVKELLARIADRGPLVLCIDDLQWGDNDSAALLLDLLSPPDPPAMMFIASYRGDEVERSPFLQTLFTRHPTGDDEPDRRQLPLGPLGTDDAVRLARALEREHGVARGRAQAIAQEAEGNPFFVTQLVQYLASHGDGSAEMRGQRVGERAEGGPPGAQGGLRLQDVTRARLAGLSPDARRLLEVIAVAGQPLSQAAAGSAAEVGDAETALGLLRTQAWVRTRGARRHDTVECYHDRIREIVVQTIDPAYLCERHLQIARTFEAHDEAGHMAMAEHYLAGGDAAPAAEHAVRAAEQAAHALAFDDAARMYMLALRVGDHDPERRRGLQVAGADALAHAGHAQQAAEHYLAAADGASRDTALHLHRRAAEQLLVSGHLDEGQQALKLVLDAEGLTMPGSPRAALASLAWRRLRVRMRGLQFERRPAESIDPHLLRRVDTCWVGTVGLMLMDTIRASDFQARHLLLALSAGEPFRVARALTLEAAFTATWGADGRARALSALDRARALSAELDEPYVQGMVALSESMIGYLTSHWQDSFEAAERAEQILTERCNGVMWELAATRRFMLSSLHFMGRIADASRRGPPLLRESQERGNLFAETDLHTRLLVPILLASDQPALACERADAALARWSRRGYHLQHHNHSMTHAQCALYAGDAPLALAHLRRSWAPLSRSGLMRLQALRVEALHLLGRVLLSQPEASMSGHVPEVQQIVEKLVRESAPWAPGGAESLRAGMAARAGDMEAARGALERSIEIYERSAMAWHAAAARDRLGALIGGDAGAGMRASASAYFEAQGVQRPERFVAMMNPGF